jgi:hypothetical protein
MGRMVLSFLAGVVFCYLATAVMVTGFVRTVVNVHLEKSVPLGLTYPYWMTCTGFAGWYTRPAPNCFRSWAKYEPVLGK